MLDETSIKRIVSTMSRKINIGNYETKDYSVTIEVDKTLDQRPFSEIAADIRKILEDEVNWYYDQHRPQAPKEDKALNELLEKIHSVKSRDELHALDQQVKIYISQTKEQKSANLLTTAYNLRALKFSTL